MNTVGNVPIKIIYTLHNDSIFDWDFGKSFEWLFDFRAKRSYYLRDRKEKISNPRHLLSRQILTLNAQIFDSIPYGASLLRGAKVIGASGLPAAFLLDIIPSG
jgi:hypothetical protein